MFKSLHFKSLMLLLSLLVGGVGSAWADETLTYTLTPAAGSNSNYTGNCDIVINGITWNVAGNSQLIPWRIGGKSLTSVDRAVYSKTAMESTISKVELNVGNASSISVNSLKLIVASDASFNTQLDEVTQTFAANSTITFTPTSGTEWATGAYYKFVFNVTVSSTSNKFVEFTNAKFYSASAPSYTITAQSNNNSYGTVSLSGNVITATPEDGYRYAVPAYTVSSGTASVLQNGNEFTVTPSSDCIVTINFEEKPSVSGYVVDFEEELDAYVDWVFTNAEQGTVTISGHDNSAFYATTGGKTTASFQTKEKVPYPNVFTCYLSKTSGNTTSSTWYIQVSDNGTDWTNVEAQSATSMSAGNWTEFTADIKAEGHTNVYVRLYYDGSTAIRAVDDISLTTYTPAAVEEPVISVTTPFTFSTTATITCVTEGATIYYSYDNSTWTEYTEGLSITSTTTIYAKAVKGSDESTVAQVTATKELATPNVTISSSSISIGGTATVTTDGPAVTLSTPDDAIASVSGTTVTGVAAGTATITATWSANSDYAAGTKDFEVTVTDPNAPGSENNPYTVAQAIAATPATGTSANVYIHGIVSSFYNNNSNVTTDNYHRYYISDDGTTNSQLLVFNGKGLNNNPFSSADDLMIGDEITIYGGLTTFSNASEVAKDNYIVSLHRQRKDPTIPDYADASREYGNTYTVDDSSITGGEISVTSSNENVATVNGLVITPVAVGTTTITVATTENAQYNAGSDTFTLTVTAPVGKTTAAANGFVKVKSTSDITDGQYLIVCEEGSVAFDGSLETLDAVGNTINVTIVDDKIEATNSTKASAFTIDATDGTIQSASGYYIGQNSDANGLATSTETAYTNNLSIVDGGNAEIISSGSAYLRYNSAANQTRFRYFKSSTYTAQKAIQLYKLSEANFSVKLNGSGYATYCSEYPLDFSNASDYTAWQATSNDGSTITFTKITGSVKGGTGILLRGEPNADVTLTSVDSSDELTGNLLAGTLAPTYIADNKGYGLSGNKFVKINAGVINTNKAYLPINGGNNARLSIDFEDETTTGIENNIRESMTNNRYYNMNGQRVNQPAKGMYIMNGKKVIIK